MFECLVGFPPFCSETPNETYKKIVNWRDTLYVPEEISFSNEAWDLLRGYNYCLCRLLNESTVRYPKDAIFKHPFFKNLDWNLLRTFNPPFVPKLSSITDTSYFSVEDVAGIPQALSSSNDNEQMDVDINPNNDLAFLGYSYKRFIKKETNRTRWETLRQDL